jgi:uncharacterized protein with FMN-binding domain
MKKIVMWLMSTLTVLVLLFGYHTSTSSTAAAAGGNTSAATPYTGSTTASGTASTPTTGSSSSSSSASAAASPSSSATSGTVTGTAADTRWGPVQVQITIASGAITNVSVVQYPNSNGKDEEINARALPILIQETLKAQSADIDMVSGATYTSDGYLTSLQSALDQAGL